MAKSKGSTIASNRPTAANTKPAAVNGRPQDDPAQVPQGLQAVAKVAPTAEVASLGNLECKLDGVTITAFPHVFKTGSVGWLAVQRTVIGGRPVQATLTIVVSGSKPKQA